MIEELKEDELIEKVGGRFRLSVLIQQRLVYLNRGSKSYVDGGEDSERDRKNKLQMVIKEILEDKIYLDMDGKMCSRDGMDIDPATINHETME